jgi:glycosyltransferase involved in cell wall biosynthesis
MPDVSVVIPTWERAATIVASVTSVLREPDVAVEVVVVDDGSTDDTCARLAALGDPHVRVLGRPHEGIAAARNAGVAATTAAVVAFHDSDDEALPGRLGRALARLRADPGIEFVVQNGRMLPPPGSDAPARPWIAPAVARRLAAAPLGVREVFDWNLGQLQGMCFRRSALDRAGRFDGRFRILDDLDLVLRVAASSRGAFIDAEAFVYRTHAGGISRDRTAVRREAIAVADSLAHTHPDAVGAIGPERFRRRQRDRWLRLARAARRRGARAEMRSALREARRLAGWNVAARLAAARIRLGI